MSEPHENIRNLVKAFNTIHEENMEEIKSLKREIFNLELEREGLLIDREIVMKHRLGE